MGDEDTTKPATKPRLDHPMGGKGDIEAAARKLYESEHAEMTMVDTDKYGKPVTELQWDHEHPEIKDKYRAMVRAILGE